eukprot:CAMPEP_0198141418 /NCGR_PEP_ID=MMETSP1443-20131203/4433_1 /TAXON_ID=186043 /ORGANISM="Entomoneis sp., Strain CCMP2396" /LENGTH=44 /DNA_ID= /DNA_START= /DNA_END= /DNA_ORIENTATION=
MAGRKKLRADYLHSTTKEHAILKREFVLFLSSPISGHNLYLKVV